MINVFLVCLNRCVDIIVREIEQEGFVVLPLFEKANGFLGQAFGQVLAFLF